MTLIKNTISRRGNLYDLKMHAIVSECTEGDMSLSTAAHYIRTRMHEATRASTATLTSSYRVKEFNDRLEIIHMTKKERLIATLTYDKARNNS